MKKLVLAVAVIFSTGTMIFAQPNLSALNNEYTKEIAQDDFKEVSSESLNSSVQTAVTELKKTNEVKKLEYSEGQKQTRITIVDKSSNAEKVVLLDDAGKTIE